MTLAQLRYEKTEKGKATQRRWAQSHKGRIRKRANSRRDSIRHPGRDAARARIYHAQNRDRKLAGMRAYHAKGGGASKSLTFWLRQERNSA